MNRSAGAAEGRLNCLLDRDQLVKTAGKVRDRVADRFPGAGLVAVAEGVVAAARAASERAAAIARPNRWLRAGQGVLVLVALAGAAAFEHVRSAHGTVTYMPIKNGKKWEDKGKDPYAPRKGDTEWVREWRGRMGTEAAREIYKQRSSSAEWVNAGCRNRGLYRLVVRGVEKVRCCALWQALAHNLMVSWRAATRRQNPVTSDDPRE
jgi:hypothetical protein